ncbi:MAG: hypothetical protein M0Z50_00855 [Planctomycetia bacterium]|nr:hypothetical protein [Planctomycetia bacterium]
MQKVGSTFDLRAPSSDNTKPDGMKLWSVAELLKHKENSRAKSLLWMLVIGIPLSLPLPIILGSMAYLAFRQFSDENGSWLVWLLFIAGFCALFLPLLLWREKSNLTPEVAIIRTQEEEDERRVISVEKNEPELQSFAPLGMPLLDDQPDAEHWALRPFFFGPRIIARAIPQQKLLRQLAARADRVRAATVLIQLASRDRGLDTSDLLQSHEDPKMLTPTLEYLRQLEWVDFRADGSRIWLNSASRDQVTHVLVQFTTPEDSHKCVPHTNHQLYGAHQ